MTGNGDRSKSPVLPMSHFRVRSCAVITALSPEPNTSRAIGGHIGAVLVGVVAVLLCSTAATCLPVVGRPVFGRRHGLARGPVLVLAESL